MNKSPVHSGHQNKKDYQLQIKELKEQLKLAKKQALYIDYEYALGGRQKPPTLKAWKDEPAWDAKERTAQIETLNLDPNSFGEHGEHKLLLLVYQMIENLGIIKEFNISEATLKSFLLNVRTSYRLIPFHNWKHAFNVAQTLYYFVVVCDAGEHFSVLEKFAMMLSALCHDVDHPGFSNTFLCNSESTLARFYNDTSVLENHHCHETFELLRKPGCEILETLTSDQKKTVRRIIIDCILATDLAVHGNYMAQLKKMHENGGPNWSSDEDKKLVMCCLIKGADISNEIRPSEIGKGWAERVMTEFFAQAALEKEKGLPVAPLMDPEKTNTPSGQIGFIGFLCLPFFSEMVKLFPKMQVCIKQMEINKQRWEEIKAELQQKETQAHP